MTDTISGVVLLVLIPVVAFVLRQPRVYLRSWLRKPSLQDSDRRPLRRVVRFALQSIERGGVIQNANISMQCEQVASVVAYVGPRRDQVRARKDGDTLSIIVDALPSQVTLVFDVVMRSDPPYAGGFTCSTVRRDSNWLRAFGSEQAQHSRQWAFKDSGGMEEVGFADHGNWIAVVTIILGLVACLVMATRGADSMAQRWEQLLQWGTWFPGLIAATASGLLFRLLRTEAPISVQHYQEPWTLWDPDSGEVEGEERKT